MILNLTMNLPESFNNDEVVDYRKTDVVKQLALLWGDGFPDHASIAKNIAEIALDSGYSKAIIDVPSFAASAFETELLKVQISPIYFSQGKFIEVNTELLLNNLYDILEVYSDGGENIQQTDSKEVVEYVVEDPLVELPDQDLMPESEEIEITDHVAPEILSQPVVNYTQSKNDSISEEVRKLRSAHHFNISFTPKKK